MIKNYDPARVFGENVVKHLGFPFENPEIGERIIYTPEGRLEGKGSDEIRADVLRSYDAFRRAEEYAQAQTFSYTDEEALSRATELYESVLLIVIANFCSVYIARLKEDTEEARAERELLDRLNDKDINEAIVNAAPRGAKVFSERWIKDNGPEHARRLLHNFDLHITKQLAAAAILQADKEVPHDAPEEVWQAAFDRFHEDQIKHGFKQAYIGYTQYEAQNILENDFKPVEMPLEVLRTWVGIARLKAKAEGNATQSDPTGGLQSSGITLITSKLVRHMNGFITSRRENLTENLQAQKGRCLELMRARSRLDLPRGTERPDATKLLEKMQRTLLRHKEEGASLLKTHLYLGDRAYKQGGGTALHLS